MDTSAHTGRPITLHYRLVGDLSSEKSDRTKEIAATLSPRAPRMYASGFCVLTEEIETGCGSPRQSVPAAALSSAAWSQSRCILHEHTQLGRPRTLRRACAARCRASRVTSRHSAGRGEPWRPALNPRIARLEEPRHPQTSSVAANRRPRDSARCSHL